MAKCIKCNKEIGRCARKCKYCLSEQINRLPDNYILISSTPNIEGFEIIEYYGWICGEVVVPNGLLGALTSGTFFTIESLDRARGMAVDALKEKANNLGANAIISIDVDISDLNGKGVLVSANGTAVYIIPQNLKHYEDELRQNEQKLQEEQIKKEQIRQEKINEIVNSESSDGLKSFFNLCETLNKYIDIENLWNELHLNEIEDYSELDNQIKNKAYVEKLYGSRENDVKNHLLKWKNGEWN